MNYVNSFKVAALGFDRTEVNKYINQLAKTIGGLEEEIESLKSASDSAAANNSKSAQELISMEGKLNEANIQIDTLKKESETRQAEIDELKRKLQENDSGDKLNAAQKNIDALKDEVSRLNEEVNKCRQAEKVLINEISGLVNFTNDYITRQKADSDKFRAGFDAYAQKYSTGEAVAPVEPIEAKPVQTVSKPVPPAKQPAPSAKQPAPPKPAVSKPAAPKPAAPKPTSPAQSAQSAQPAQSVQSVQPAKAKEPAVIPADEIEVVLESMKFTAPQDKPAVKTDEVAAVVPEAVQAADVNAGNVPSGSHTKEVKLVDFYEDKDSAKDDFIKPFSFEKEEENAQPVQEEPVASIQLEALTDDNLSSGANGMDDLMKALQEAEKALSGNSGSNHKSAAKIWSSEVTEKKQDNLSLDSEISLNLKSLNAAVAEAESFTSDTNSNDFDNMFDTAATVPEEENVWDMAFDADEIDEDDEDDDLMTTSFKKKRL